MILEERLVPERRVITMLKNRSGKVVTFWTGWDTGWYRDRVTYNDQGQIVEISCR